MLLARTSARVTSLPHLRCRQPGPRAYLCPKPSPPVTATTHDRALNIHTQALESTKATVHADLLNTDLTDMLGMPPIMAHLWQRAMPFFLLFLQLLILSWSAVTSAQLSFAESLIQFWANITFNQISFAESLLKAVEAPIHPSFDGISGECEVMGISIFNSLVGPVLLLYIGLTQIFREWLQHLQESLKPKGSELVMYQSTLQRSTCRRPPKKRDYDLVARALFLRGPYLFFMIHAPRSKWLWDLNNNTSSPIFDTSHLLKIWMSMRMDLMRDLQRKKMARMATVGVGKRSTMEASLLTMDVARLKASCGR